MKQGLERDQHDCVMYTIECKVPAFQGHTKHCHGTSETKKRPRPEPSAAVFGSQVVLKRLSGTGSVWKSMVCLGRPSLQQKYHDKIHQNTITKKTLWIGCCTQLLSQPFVHLDSLDLDLETLRAMIHTTVHYHRLLRYTVLHTTESTLSFRFYSQQGGRTLKDEIFKVQHADFLIFKCFVQLQSLQYQLSNRSSSV